MQRWLSFGASEIGPAHITTGKPNQDSWASFHHAGCDVLVVSDGLGSKEYSEFGSAMACRAVDHAVCSALASNGSVSLKEPADRAKFLDAIRDIWVEGIAPLTARDAATTCIFAFRAGDGNMWMAMLGDGLAAAVLNDGSIELLQEAKDDSFSNMTNSLSELTDASDWLVVSIPEKRCNAVLMCTDGIADDLEDVEGFVRNAVESFCSMPAITASSEALNMLIDWPTPKHSDDKTVACLFKREYQDE